MHFKSERNWLVHFTSINFLGRYEKDVFSLLLRYTLHFDDILWICKLRICCTIFSFYFYYLLVYNKFNIVCGDWLTSKIMCSNNLLALFKKMLHLLIEEMLQKAGDWYQVLETSHNINDIKKYNVYFLYMTTYLHYFLFYLIFSYIICIKWVRLWNVLKNFSWNSNIRVLLWIISRVWFLFTKP